MEEVNRDTCVFFKKRVRHNVRCKKDSSSSSDDEALVKRREKRPVPNVLSQQTTNFASKRKCTSSAPNEEEGDEDSFETVSYKASYSKESRIGKDNLATATVEIDTDQSVDAQAIFERAQQLNKDATNADRRVYKGMNNYAQYIEKKDTVMGNASSGFNRKGPMRAPSNLRATVRWDYQPDICKDYKETGFCSFGDSCKFLHDRSDYKHGWQIEQELAEGVYGIDGEDNRYEILQNSSDEDNGEDIPFYCLICRKDYKDPVVTNCRHYFCSECALKRYKKTARCYACTTDTKGFFKFAKNLGSKLAALREKRAKTGDNEIWSDSDQETEKHCCTSSHHNPHHSESEISADGTGSEITEQIRPGESSQVKLPASSEPKWAQPEAPEYCNSDEESD